MKLGKKRLRLRWDVVIPVILMVVGISIHVNTAMQVFLRQSDKPSPPLSLAITQQSNQSLNTTPAPIVATKGNKNFSYKEIQQGIAGKPKFGYFPYPEGNPNKMMLIGSYSQPGGQIFERLAPDAGLALMKLISAARNEGVWIIPVSGFRSIADQENLFNAQVQQSGSPEAAAKLIAPPGYSEHQTGYAIDLADGHFAKQDITSDFVKTDAFRWLSRHGNEFGFELSFPENNPQGVRYEPWHWRFIGSPEAQAILRRSDRKD